MLGIDHAFFMAAWNEHQGAVEFIHIVQKNGYVHGPFGGHHVIVEPSAVVLVPLPYIAFKSHLAVDLELVHVQLLAKQVLNRRNHARVSGQFRKRFAVHMRCKIRANRVLALFTHIERFATAVEARNFFHHDACLFWVEQTREKQIAFFVKLLVLRLRKFHGMVLKS